MPLPNATPPLQRVSNENSAPSVGGLPARGSSEPCRGLSIFWPSFVPSLARSLSSFIRLEIHGRWSFCPTVPDDELSRSSSSAERGRGSLALRLNGPNRGFNFILHCARGDGDGGGESRQSQNIHERRRRLFLSTFSANTGGGARTPKAVGFLPNSKSGLRCLGSTCLQLDRCRVGGLLSLPYRPTIDRSGGAAAAAEKEDGHLHRRAE